MPFERTPPDAREGELWQGILRRLTALEARPGRIPELDADPPATSAANLWMLTDGRLRGRRWNGEIVEWVPTDTPGSPSSGEPRPPAPPVPQHYIEEWPAVWSATYGSDGSKVTGERLRYGNDGTPAGQFVAAWGFDAADIQAVLAGATVQRVELLLQSVETASVVGSTAVLGAVTTLSEPATSPAVVQPSGQATLLRLAPVSTQWHRLDAGFGRSLQGGSITGMALYQSPDSGAVAGVGDPVAVSPPTVRVTYLR